MIYGFDFGIHCSAGLASAGRSEIDFMNIMLRTLSTRLKLISRPWCCAVFVEIEMDLVNQVKGPGVSCPGRNEMDSVFSSGSRSLAHTEMLLDLSQQTAALNG